MLGLNSSGIITNMEDYGDLMNNAKLELMLAFCLITKGHSLPSSPLLPAQEQQEKVKNDEGEEPNVALRIRPYMFEPLALEIALGKMTKVMSGRQQS